jgi:hypothetical protein
MHPIDGFGRPRPESVMTDGELQRVSVPTMFCWGTSDLDDPAGCAKLVTSQLTATGFAPGAR